MGDGFFEPEELTVRVGEEVTIEVINPDTREHDLVIVREVFDFEFQANGAVETDPGVVVGRLERIKPGESDSITVTFDAPGEYQFFCGMFHHFAQGAHGIITVES
jgi:plastocyanin